MSAQERRSFGDGKQTPQEAFLDAIERAEWDDPRNGASACAEWLRAIAYGLAAITSGRGGVDA